MLNFFITDEIHTSCKLNGLSLAYSNLLCKTKSAANIEGLCRRKWFQNDDFCYTFFQYFPFMLSFLGCFIMQTWAAKRAEENFIQTNTYIVGTVSVSESATVLWHKTQPGEQFEFWHANKTTNASPSAFVIPTFNVNTECVLNWRGFSLSLYCLISSGQMLPKKDEQ